MDDSKIDTEQTLGRVQMMIMQNLVSTMAQKNQYDTQNISELHRGSVIFRDEIEDIVNNNTVHFEDMRR